MYEEEGKQEVPTESAEGEGDPWWPESFVSDCSNSAVDCGNDDETACRSAVSK